MACHLVPVYSNCLPSSALEGVLAVSLLDVHLYDDETVVVAEQETGWNHLKGLSLLAFWCF